MIESLLDEIGEVFNGDEPAHKQFIIPFIGRLVFGIVSLLKKYIFINTVNELIEYSL